ncbi:unnamed protein product [Symbiodinium sp. CCMP2592]|nr:unnamed protein product [Symbiodinium sp. CCMP2592]
MVKRGVQDAPPPATRKIGKMSPSPVPEAAGPKPAMYVKMKEILGSPAVKQFVKEQGNRAVPVAGFQIYDQEDYTKNMKLHGEYTCIMNATAIDPLIFAHENILPGVAAAERMMASHWMRGKAGGLLWSEPISVATTSKTKLPTGSLEPLNNDHLRMAFWLTLFESLKGGWSDELIVAFTGMPVRLVFVASEEEKEAFKWNLSAKLSSMNENAVLRGYKRILGIVSVKDQLQKWSRDSSVSQWLSKEGINVSKEVVKSMVLIRNRIVEADLSGTFDLLEETFGINHQLSKQAVLDRIMQLTKVEKDSKQQNALLRWVVLDIFNAQKVRALTDTDNKGFVINLAKTSLLSRRLCYLFIHKLRLSKTDCEGIRTDVTLGAGNVAKSALGFYQNFMTHEAWEASELGSLASNTHWLSDTLQYQQDSLTCMRLFFQPTVQWYQTLVESIEKDPGNMNPELSLQNPRWQKMSELNKLRIIPEVKPPPAEPAEVLEPKHLAAEDRDNHTHDLCRAAYLAGQLAVTFIVCEGFCAIAATDYVSWGDQCGVHTPASYFQTDLCIAHQPEDPNDEAMHKALADGLNMMVDSEEAVDAQSQESEQATMLQDTFQHVLLPADLKSTLLKMDTFELAKLVSHATTRQRLSMQMPSQPASPDVAQGIDEFMEECWAELPASSKLVYLDGKHFGQSIVSGMPLAYLKGCLAKVLAATADAKLRSLGANDLLVISDGRNSKTEQQIKREVAKKIKELAGDMCRRKSTVAVRLLYHYRELGENGHFNTRNKAAIHAALPDPLENLFLINTRKDGSLPARDRKYVGLEADTCSRGMPNLSLKTPSELALCTLKQDLAETIASTFYDMGKEAQYNGSGSEEEDHKATDIATDKEGSTKYVPLFPFGTSLKQSREYLNLWGMTGESEKRFVLDLAAGSGIMAAACCCENQKYLGVVLSALQKSVLSESVLLFIMKSLVQGGELRNMDAVKSPQKAHESPVTLASSQAEAPSQSQESESLPALRTVDTGSAGTDTSQPSAKQMASGAEPTGTGESSSSDSDSS